MILNLKEDMIIQVVIAKMATITILLIVNVNYADYLVLPVQDLK